MKKKVTAIVQARVGSSRLPGKVLKKINKKETILLLLNRLSRSKKIDDIIVAIPKKSKDDKLYKILVKNNYKVFRGSENNVLKRYCDCATKFSIYNILRITGDNPLVDPNLVDKVVDIYQKKNFDYISNIEKRTFPKGLDIEVFSHKALQQAYLKTNSKFDKEHVTPYLRRNLSKRYNYVSKEDFSSIRITLDTIHDLNLIKKIYYKFGNKIFYYKDIISFYKKNKKIFKQTVINNSFI